MKKLLLTYLLRAYQPPSLTLATLIRVAHILGSLAIGMLRKIRLVHFCDLYSLMSAFIPLKDYTLYSDMFK